MKTAAYNLLPDFKPYSYLIKCCLLLCITARIHLAYAFWTTIKPWFMEMTPPFSFFFASFGFSIPTPPSTQVLSLPFFVFTPPTEQAHTVMALALMWYVIGMMRFTPVLMSSQKNHFKGLVLSLLTFAPIALNLTWFWQPSSLGPINGLIGLAFWFWSWLETRFLSTRLETFWFNPIAHHLLDERQKHELLEYLLQLRKWISQSIGITCLQPLYISTLSLIEPISFPEYLLASFYTQQRIPLYFAFWHSFPVNRKKDSYQAPLMAV